MRSKRMIVLRAGLIMAGLFLGLLSTDTVYAAVKEVEPNNTAVKAQSIKLGTEYTGQVEDSDSGDDEDYYKIAVKEGNFYKISVYEMKDLDDYGWGTMIVSLCKDSNTEDRNTVSNGNYNKTSKLFRAAYTGSYYLKFWNTSNTKYSFKVEKYNPKGRKIKDSDSNIYKITSNFSIELSKIASKRKTDFYISEKEYFTTIDNMEVLDSYNTEFTVSSIGAYAFKGSSIKSISIPEEVKKIGAGAFQNCKKLGTESYLMGVVIRGKKVVISKNAFKGCSRLGSVRVLKSASIKSIGKNAFKGTKKGIRLEVPGVKKYKKLFKKAGLKKPKYSKAYM
ncbi:MAG: leucine-rich repeat domain-containing protein [Lachnospiraceae bacterium]|nr:leucine-rich repeat domain-containing protein [Lachnospiraceae bacterium]